MKKNQRQHAKTTKTLAQRARELRHNQTKAEEHLWSMLRGRRLDGIKFRRQHPIGPFIVDFCCVYASLVIELDGGIHESQKERDAERTLMLESLGFRVVRFRNEEALYETERVLAEIASHCKLPQALFCKEPATPYFTSIRSIQAI